MERRGVFKTSQSDSKETFDPSQYPLLLRRYKQRTIEEYGKEVEVCWKWLKENGVALHSARDVDIALVRYMHGLHDRLEGRGVQRAVNTMYGVVSRMPWLRRNLPMASQCLSGWRRERPSKQHPPLTWPVTCAIAVRMALHGRVREAIGTLVAFHCQLRADEVVKVRREDVIDGRDLRYDRRIARTEIVIRDAKTGLNQCVHVFDAAVLRLLYASLDAARPGTRLWGDEVEKPYGRYYRLFKSVVAELGLSPAFVPHSLRHGGTTQLHLSGWSMESTKHRGRWRRLDTAERYIQSGRALLGSALVPEEVARDGQLFARDIGRALALAQLHFVKGGGQDGRRTRRSRSAHR